jgi:hypothetical protein
MSAATKITASSSKAKASTVGSERAAPAGTQKPAPAKCAEPPRHYVGLDVSLKETSICVLNDADKVEWRERFLDTQGSGGGDPKACAAR